MKDFKKLMVVALFMLMSFGGKIAAYTYKITNETRKDIKVKLFYEFFGDKELHNKYRLIERFETGVFKFKGSKCLNEVKVQEEKGGKWQKAKKAKWKTSKILACGNKHYKLTLKDGIFYLYKVEAPKKPGLGTAIIEEFGKSPPGSLW